MSANDKAHHAHAHGHAKTGLLVKMRRKALNPEEKEVTEDSTFSDFQKVAGMIVPMKLAVAHDGKPFMSVTVSDYKPAEKLDGFGESSWLGRTSQPVEQAPAYVFLASPESSFVVGEVINVNGGANVP